MSKRTRLVTVIKITITHALKKSRQYMQSFNHLFYSIQKVKQRKNKYACIGIAKYYIILAKKRYRHEFNVNTVGRKHEQKKKRRKK